MNIEVHVVCWNEEELLPYFIRHYQTLADRIIVHDNYSSDHTRTVARNNGCEVWLFGNPGEFNEDCNTSVKNWCWKSSSADYVIIVDTDEFLRTTREELAAAHGEGANIFHTSGFDMVSENMPVESIWEINEGVPNNDYSKPCIFAPRAFLSFNYVHGAHRADPDGKEVYAQSRLKLCHYKWIGGPARVHARHGLCVERMLKINQDRHWGVHWRASLFYDRTRYMDIKTRSAPVFTPPGPP